MKMSESKAQERILAYVAEIIMNMDLEANSDIINVVPEATSTKNISRMGQTIALESRRLNCIYDDDPLGFEKDPRGNIQRMKARDPLKEVDLCDGKAKRITCISAKVDSKMKKHVIKFLKEFKYFFAWKYNEMQGLSREMVKMRLPISVGKRPVKKTPRRFTPKVLSKIKIEIEHLLRSKFISTTIYVEWFASIVPVIKTKETEFAKGLEILSKRKNKNKEM